MIHLMTNSLSAGGNVRATLQQLSDTTGLGSLWSDVLGDWTTAPTPFDDMSFQVVEQVFAESSVAYYGNAIFNNETFTGRLVVGYHDMNGAGFPIVFSEVKYVRRGEELAFTIADDRLNMDVSRIFVFELSKRTDNTYAAKDPITIAPEDDIDFSFNLPALFPAGHNVARITTVTVSPSGTLAVESVGPQGLYPILSTSGGQVAGTDYTVSCVALLNTGAQVKCQGVLKCVA